MTLPLSKYLDPADFAELTEELAIVDQHFTSAREQHPMRRWEYAMALRAFTTWGGRAVHECVDVGGAGSPFWRMLLVDNVLIVDPEVGQTLAQYLTHSPRPRLADVVFCLSVLEHVEDLDQFLYHLSCLTAPGGLLCLTMDACGCPSHGADCAVGDPPDQHHFHWMRKRCFGRRDVAGVVDQLSLYACRPIGEVAYAYPGPAVYDYDFFSLVLVKRS